MSPSSVPTGRCMGGKHEKKNKMEQIIMRSVILRNGLVKEEARVVVNTVWFIHN